MDDVISNLLSACWAPESSQSSPLSISAAPPTSISFESVYAKWAGAMLDLVLSRGAATDVNKRSSVIAAESLLALADDRDLVVAGERERRVVFRNSYELAKNQQYRARSRPSPTLSSADDARRPSAHDPKHVRKNESGDLRPD